jgi:DNA-binding NarL/FixJ family response regulator
VVTSVSVLVIDDDVAFRGLALRILRSHGFAIVGEAGTVEHGMAAAMELQPEAILVDVRLPDGSGIALARSLAALPWTPRIVLTSSDDDAADEIAAGEDARSLAFVPKDELPNAPLVALLAVG